MNEHDSDCEYPINRLYVVTMIINVSNSSIDTSNYYYNIEYRVYSIVSSNNELKLRHTL